MTRRLSELLAAFHLEISIKVWPQKKVERQPFCSLAGVNTDRSSEGVPNSGHAVCLAWGEIAQSAIDAVFRDRMFNGIYFFHDNETEKEIRVEMEGTIVLKRNSELHVFMELKVSV